jgi:ankyrin repeat protein
MVFKKDTSLLKARNKMLETPLHFAAKAGNEELVIKLIQLSHTEVKNVFRCTNCLGEMAFRIAAKHNHEFIFDELM